MGRVSRRGNPADGYSYGRFCELYHDWARTLDVVLRHDHRAGEKMFVDYAGDKIPIHDDHGWRRACLVPCRPASSVAVSTAPGRSAPSARDATSTITSRSSGTITACREFTGPLWINDSGEIAGQYVDTQSSRMRGYVESRGAIKTFDAPGNPTGTYAYHITNTGTVLLGGSYDESSPYCPWHCFSLTGGVFTALPNVPFPDATMSYAIGLNDRGEISGGWIDTTGLSHAFVAFRK